MDRTRLVYSFKLSSILNVALWVKSRCKLMTQNCVTTIANVAKREYLMLSAQKSFQLFFDNSDFEHLCEYTPQTICQMWGVDTLEWWSVISAVVHKECFMLPVLILQISAKTQKRVWYSVYYMPDIGRWHTSVVISNISCRSTGVADQLPVWCRQDGTSSNEPCQHPRSDSLLCLFVCLLCVFLFSYIVFFNFFIICICLSRQEET